MKRVAFSLLVLAASSLTAWEWCWVPCEPFCWTGFYIGGHVGYAGGRQEAHALPGNIYNSSSEYIELTTDRTFGGMQGGFNWQFSPLLVAGFEADFGFMDITGARPSGKVFNPQQDTFLRGSDGWYGTQQGA